MTKLIVHKLIEQTSVLMKEKLAILMTKRTTYGMKEQTDILMEE